MAYKRRYNPLNQPSNNEYYERADNYYIEEKKNSDMNINVNNEHNQIENERYIDYEPPRQQQIEKEQYFDFEHNKQQQSEKEQYFDYEHHAHHQNMNKKKGALKNIKIDDLALLALIFLLLSQEEKDMTLIIALGFLFICEYVDLDKLLDNFI